MAKKICFLVGSMSISGGTYVIVQHACYLKSHGYEVTLGVQEKFTSETIAWHDSAVKLNCVPIEEAKSTKYDLVIATWWKTAFELHNFESNHYGYFVQSIESRFYPEKEVPLRSLVEATYKLPCSFVTEASWIKDYLKDIHNQDAQLVRNGIRKDIYSPVGRSIEKRNPKSQPRILVEGHFGVSFKNTALGIRLAREAGAKDIWLLTGSPVSYVPGVNKVFSKVPMMLTPEIYRSCDILIKLSTVEGMFGPPLEIFHCGGTALVFDVTGHDEYIIDGINACVVKRGDMDGVVQKLKKLLNDPLELERLKAGALNTAKAWSSWEESSAAFSSWVEATLLGASINRQEMADISAKAYSEYERAEKYRLSKLTHIPRYRLSALAAYLPAYFQRLLKKWEAIKEVSFGPREVR